MTLAAARLAAIPALSTFAVRANDIAVILIDNTGAANALRPELVDIFLSHIRSRISLGSSATSLSDQCTPGLRSAMEGEIASPAQTPRRSLAKNCSGQLWDGGCAVRWRRRARPRHRAGSVLCDRNADIKNFCYISAICAMNVDRPGYAQAPLFLFCPCDKLHLMASRRPPAAVGWKPLRQVVDLISTRRCRPRLQ
jgi:hypothetical protein